MLNPNLNNGGTMCTARTDLIAGTTTTYTTSVATDFMIDGKWGVNFATKTNQATPTTDANTGVAFPVVADDKGCALVFGVNAAGAVQLVQGALQSLDATSAEFIIAPHFPRLPDDFCPIGYVIVANASGSDFTTGTTDWADVTTTFVDVAMMPDRPQES